MTLLEELDFSSSEPLIEMANFRQKKTGFPGVVFVSSKIASHGPRVKYYAKADKSSPSFSVSIELEPKVVANSMPLQDAKFFAKYVIEFVRENYDLLIDFWYNGENYDSDQLINFINHIKSV